MTDQKEYADGIWLNISFEDYKKIDRHNASGIKKLNVSAGDYWKNSPMNKHREEDDSDSEAKTMGSAYHVALLEPEKFQSLYVRKLSKTEPEYLEHGIFTNATQVGNKLEEYGQAKKKSGENALAQAKRLEAAGFRGYIWAIEEANHLAMVDGRIELNGKKFDQLLRDVKYIHAIPEMRDYLLGGLSEVTILWTDSAGNKFKIRVDKLKADRMGDLKSFDNVREVPLEDCLRAQVRYMKQYIQGGLYWNGGRAITINDLQLMDATESQSGHAQDIIDQIKARNMSLPFWFVYKQKSGVPNCVARRFNTFNIHLQDAGGMSDAKMEELAEKNGHFTGLYLKAMAEINHGLKTYKKYMDIYGVDEPWNSTELIGQFDDSHFYDRWLFPE